MVSLIIIFGTLTPQTALAASSAVKVFLDGKEIVYDVPPQIIASHTMVPLSFTIEAITGSPANWNADTKTVTFYAGGHTNIHKIGEKIVYVDGKPVTFDTPSLIVDSRTLVPIRMIAETSGCTVDWDGTQRYVIITSPPSAPPDATEYPKILECTPQRTDVEKGSSFTITVTTNMATQSVFAERQFGVESWQGLLTDAGNDRGRQKWEITCRPSESGDITVYASLDNTRTESDSRMVYVQVKEAATEAAKILDYTTPGGTTITKGSKLKVKVTTNGTAQSVWVTGQNGEKWTAKLTDNGNADGKPKWEVSCYPSKTGILTIYANKTSSATDAAKETVNVTVTETVSEAKTVLEPKILSYATPNGTEIDDDEEFVVVVTVNSAVEDVWVENKGGGRWQGTMTDAGNADGQQKWTVVCNPPLVTGSLYINTQTGDPAEGTATKTLTITVKD